MRERLNDWLRYAIRSLLVCYGCLLIIAMRIRLMRYAWSQRSLRRRYGISAATKILTYGEELEASLQATRATLGNKAVDAFTSGSTRSPKRLVYSHQRLKQSKLLYLNAFCRVFAAMRIRRTSLFVFAPLTSEQSVTHLLLDETRKPPCLACLQAPYRVLSQPIMRTLVDTYGASAVRLWVLTVSDPGVLYATNPSTLTAFFRDVETNFAQCRRLADDFLRGTTPGELTAIFTRICAVDARHRLQQLAQSEHPLPLKVLYPRLEAYSCWNGGYVQPFIDALQTWLPASSYRFIPMYSMSTEVIETLPFPTRGSLAYLPVAAGVVYEFLPEGTIDDASQLQTPETLIPGSAYTMVVSDAFGLRRYQTEDLFRCERLVHGVPDLTFLRRRALSYSFTGEKLTAEQTTAAISTIRQAKESFLTCVPAWPTGDDVPHYKLVALHDASLRIDDAVAASHFDALLCAQNDEYAMKRRSGRLGAVQFERVSLADLARRVGGPEAVAKLDGQFKLLPLYTTRWETFA